MKKVEILDKIMGSGKTLQIIKWMADNPDERYLYITPLLSEIDEGTGRLQELNFSVPKAEEGSNKTEDFLLLLIKGVNIACTHSLYMRMSEDHLQAIRDNEYIVIIDEELPVLESFTGCSQSDIEWLKNNDCISIDAEDGKLLWVNDKHVGDEHKYLRLKMLCDKQEIFVCKGSLRFILIHLPVVLFEAAKRTIVLTYLFKGNILDCFLRLKGIEAIPFTDFTVESKSKEEIRSLITLVNLPRKLSNMSLSSGWYESATAKEIGGVSKLIRNVAVKQGAKAADTMWTLPANRAAKVGSSGLTVSPNGYREFYSEGEDGQRVVHPCWIASNIRATNKYADRWLLVHAFNRFPLVPIKMYLQSVGHPLDESVFALAEMLQWIWRSRIRKGEPIVICIVNRRMRDLFQQWLDSP